jgi:alpha-beta hydrolase superfamily lysophospholipase
MQLGPTSSSRNCTAVILALSILAPAGAQAPSPTPAPSVGDASYTVFIKGAEAGRVNVSLARAGSTWVITSTGRMGNLTINHFELKYTADWQPTELRVEATQPDRKMQLATSFGVTTAVNEITQNGVTQSKTDQISARTVVLPNNYFAAYEALAARLSGAESGTELPLYVAPVGEVRLAVRSVTAEQLKTPSGILATRKYAVTIQNIGATVDATIIVDDRNRFARLDMPAATLTVIRNDLASVTVRAVSARNPTDADVIVPANGFNIAGTLTTPPGVGRLRHPAVMLVGGSGPIDRDETVAGIPIFGQLAGSLAERGFIVLRYDKRGVGQSGGRTETVTLTDYADDLIAATRWLARRDDVDSRRLAIVGHSEGGAIAMLAAAREKKIAALVLVASIGTTGAELILEQQRHQLDLLNLPESERNEKIALQKKIHDAVVTEKGWDALPPQVRRQADTPWFRSLLTFDPASTMPHVKQPILIVQGDLDKQVAPEHAEKLAALARARKKAGDVQVVHIPDVNHLLVRATSGEVQEYPDLQEKTISPDVPVAIADWLKKTQ